MTTLQRAPGVTTERVAPAAHPAFKFMAVGASGIVVNTAAMAVAVGPGRVHYLLAAALATQASTLWNFVFTDRWVFADRASNQSPVERFIRFWAVNNTALVVRWPLLWLLAARIGVNPLLANLATLIVIFVGRYAISSGWIWPAGRDLLGRWAALDGYGTPSDPDIESSSLADRVEHRAAAVVHPRRHISAHWVLVAVVIAGAAFLRLHGVGAIGFNSDEAVYAGQGAAMVGEQPYSDFFSLFRAHPLLLQLLVGAVFKVVGVSDVAARVVVAGVFGVGAVILTYLIASQSYTRRIALVAAAAIAFMPYHVVVSRQVLVDVPMAFFVLLTIFLLKKGVDSGRQEMFLLAAASTALATLSKEVAVLVVPAAVLYLTWSRSWRWIRLASLRSMCLIYIVGISPFVLTRLLFSTGSSSSLTVFFWQFLRDPNHNPDYFGRILLQFWGLGMVSLAIWGLVVMGRRRANADLLILSFLVTFLGFFQLWPTKLYFYLIVVTPLLAIAAAIGIERLAAVLKGLLDRFSREARQGDAVVAAVLAVVAFGAVTTWAAISPAAAQVPGAGDFDIEVQTFAGARETGLWVRGNTPPGARFLTIGPSIGNIVRFYGYRDSVALSVSADPTKRNPAYVPVTNPDLALRSMDVHYIIWDAYSADRSVFYDRRLRRYIAKFDGIPVFAIYVVDGVVYESSGSISEGGEPRVIVYSVAGGNPLDGGSR